MARYTPMVVALGVVLLSAGCGRQPTDPASSAASADSPRLGYHVHDKPVPTDTVERPGNGH